MTLSKYLFHRIKVPFSTLQLTEMTFSRLFFVTLNVVFAFLWSSTLSRMQQKVNRKLKVFCHGIYYLLPLPESVGLSVPHPVRHNAANIKKKGMKGALKRVSP